MLAAAAAFVPHGSYGQTGRKSVTAAEVNGTYRMNFKGKFRDSSNEIKLLALGGGRVRVAMELLYPYMLDGGEMSANLGELDGEAKIKGDRAVYSSNEFGPCTITITFTKPGIINVEQAGADADCGFGHNVVASGVYRKVSSRRPKFEKIENILVQ
jgi:hypothetical protein